MDAFIDEIEQRGLVVGGLGSRLPMQATDGIVTGRGRGAPSESDQQAGASKPTFIRDTSPARDATVET